jgi:predicted TIM-barrel fold metal-dependent hydrolase
VRVIGFEEHYKLPAMHEANQNNPVELAYDVEKRAGRLETDAQGGWPAGIYDLGEGRIAVMDAAGIDVQILSHTVPAAETIEPSLAVDLAKQANDAVAAAVSKYHDRFRGFATLPMLNPTAAASELERVVRDLGFVGALINGHVNGRYLDDKFF